MELSVRSDDDVVLELSCDDHWVSRWVSEEILRGLTYPNLSFVDDVQVIFDVGANCGATSMYLAHHHPGAAIHAFEPGRVALEHLERNASSRPNVTVHPIGLADRDGDVPYYPGTDDIGMGSIIPRSVNDAVGEIVTVRSAGGWAAEHGIDRIDIVKIDVEGTEVEVLESLESLIPTMKVIYLEYDSRVARRRLDELVRPTHEMYFSRMMALDQGEVIYLESSLADTPVATEFLRELFTRIMGR